MALGEMKVARDSLENFAKEVFIKVGLSRQHAETVTKVLVWANLRGVDSHGVSLIPWYIEAVDIDHMKTKPKSRIEKETPAAILIDADHAFGAVVTTLAMNKVIEKASKIGIGWAFIRNTNHQGAWDSIPC